MSSVGPIVGGIIGGLAALNIGAFAYFFLYRRRGVNSQETLLSNGGPGHFRTLSDTTQLTFGNAIQQLLAALAAGSTAPVSNYTHVPPISRHSLAATQELPQTTTTLQSRMEPFVVIENPELRKGGSAARAAAIGVNEVYKDHQQHSPDHLNPNPFEQAEQAEQVTERNHPPLCSVGP
jgi:hypothetical protein